MKTIIPTNKIKITNEVKLPTEVLLPDDVTIRDAIDEDIVAANRIMNQYETDTHVPDFGTIKRIAKVLNTPTAYFFCEDDELADVIKKWYLRKKGKK